jgi:hypothetical protein
VCNWNLDILEPSFIVNLLSQNQSFSFSLENLKSDSLENLKSDSLENLRTWTHSKVSLENLRTCMKPENVENLKSISVAAYSVFDGFSEPSWRLMHQFCYLRTQEPSLTVFDILSVQFS